jgi:two-component system LytT family response regulator
MARLDPLEFLRIHRSHAVSVRELRPLLHGEYQIVLSDGTKLTSGHSFRAVIQAMFGLAQASPPQARSRSMATV